MSNTDILGYASIGIGVFWALIILFAVFKGYRRGFLRQTLRTVTIVLSVIISIAVINSAVGMVTEACEDNTLAEAIAELKVEFLLDSLDKDMLDIVNALDADKIVNVVLVPLSVFIFPLAFTIIFILISAAFYIVYAILCLLIKGLSKKRNNKTTRLLGALVGLAQGFIVATVFFLPIANVLDIADEAVGIIRHADSAEAEELSDIYDDYLTPVYNLPLRMSMSLGGKSIVNSIATIEIDGKDYNAREAIPLFAEAYTDIISLAETDLADLSGKDQALIRDVVSDLFSDRFFASSVSGLLGEIGVLMDKGIIEGTDDVQSDEFYNAALAIFKSSTAKTVEDDVNTVLDVLFLLINENALEAVTDSDSSNIVAVLTKTATYNGKSATVISHVINILDENAHTRPLVNALSKLSLTAMASHLSFGEQLDDVYEYIEEDIERLNDCHTRSEIMNTLDDIFADNNINIEDDILLNMTEYVYDEYTLQGKTISEHDMNDIVFSYYDAYVLANSQ